jgi:hypothetical protein
VEAPARGDEGESPEEIENPGEHRAPDGINPRLGATNSRGEKGPEDEPISQRTACLRFRTCTGLRSGARESGEYPVCKRVTSFGWWPAQRACDGCGARYPHRHDRELQTAPSRGRPWHEPRSDVPGQDRLRLAPSRGGRHRLLPVAGAGASR